MGDFKISTATIVRTACLLLALANQVLSAMGKPIIPIHGHPFWQEGQLVRLHPDRSVAHRKCDFR